MRHLPYWLRGLLVGAGVIAVGAIYIIVRAVMAFTGTCEGFYPYLSPDAPCTAFHFAALTAKLTFLIFLFDFWYLIVALLATTALAGHLTGRWRNGRTQ
jgi:hypothetical protein